MLIANKAKQMSIKAIIKESQFIVLETDNGLVKIKPCDAGIIRVVYTLASHFEDSKLRSLGTIPYKNLSDWSFEESEDSIIIKTEKMKLVIQKQNCSFSFYDSNSKQLFKEPDRGGKTLIPFESYKTILDEETQREKIITPDGVKQVVKEAKKIYERDLYHTRVEFEWADGEALYGLGQQEEGILNLRGTRQYIHQANMKIAMPFILSTGGYGILFDTYSPLIFNDNAFGSYIYNEAATELDYYVICGENFDEVIRGYRYLTGTATMLPKWAFGYMQSLERYESQDELLETVAKYRQIGVPLDCIILDWMSWEDGKWGQKTFDAERFPSPNQLTEKLHTQGARLMLSIWPIMHSTTDNYKEMKEQGCLFQESEIYNAFEVKARELYWNQVSDGLFCHGIDAWWCDSSEPVTPEWLLKYRPEPDQNYLDFHMTARIYMPETHTNAYPLLHAQTIYEGQRKVTDQQRVINLTRSGYTGQQKYGTILWSGDISAKWSTLKKQIASGLNLCASGLPYWTLDIGGFFVKRGDMWFWDGDYEEGCQDLGYRELYTRWYQLGAFLPIFRSHGTDTRREIWHFGCEGELFYDAIARITHLRYKLMPYIYSLAGMVTLNDYTMMRILSFDFLYDPKVYDINDQFMLGSSLMVCPVTSAMYYEASSVQLVTSDRTREVYLPKEVVWYDFWTSVKYEGGQIINAQASIDIIPLFVKAGAIIPMSDTALCTRDLVEDEMYLKIFPGADGSFTLYQDENDSYRYEDGQYSLINILWRDKESKLIIKARVGEYKGMPKTMTFNVEVIGIKQYTICYEGTEVTYGE